MESSTHLLIIEAARRALASQGLDGSMPAGHNGPHGDLETPVRNTSLHWLITWGFALKQTGKEIFRAAANHAADYLLSKEARPLGFAFPHRSTAGKDRCNGLMSPSFVLEALVAGYLYLGREDLLELAIKMVRAQEFCSQSNLWRRWEVGGRVLSVDYTLNHQIWYAASVASLQAAGCNEGAEQL